MCIKNEQREDMIYWNAVARERQAYFYFKKIRPWKNRPINIIDTAFHFQVPVYLKNISSASYNNHQTVVYIKVFYKSRHLITVKGK